LSNVTNGHNDTHSAFLSVWRSILSIIGVNLKV
jgi:hypothetical protein